jgi:predicted RNA polymerase sigma factor
VSVVAALTRRSGDLDVAEEAAAEAFATAVARWPVDGVPPNLGAWLTTTANRKAIDRRSGGRTSATTSRRRLRWSTTTTRPSLSAP